MDDIEGNKVLAKRYIQAWASRDLSEFEALLSRGFTDCMMGRIRSRGELLLEAADDSLSDVSQEIEAMLAEDDKVAVKYTTSATIVATGQPLRFTGMFILTVSGGQVTGGWGQFDRFGIRQQLSGRDAPMPAGQYPPRAEGVTSSSESKLLCARYFEAWNKADLPSFESLLAPGFVDYMMGQPRTRRALLEQVAAARATPVLIEATPRIDVLLAEGDLACLHWTTNATHAASGKPVSWTGMFIVTTANGEVTGGWGERDTVTIREQLGNL